MKAKIIDSLWWSPWMPNKFKLGASLMGIDTVTVQVAAVVIRTEKGFKCYIGVTDGDDQKRDEQWVAMHGAKVIPRMAKAMFPHIGNFIM